MGGCFGSFLAVQPWFSRTAGFGGKAVIRLGFRRCKDLLPTLLCFPVSNQFQGVFGHQSTYGSGAVGG